MVHGILSWVNKDSSVIVTYVSPPFFETMYGLGVYVSGCLRVWVFTCLGMKDNNTELPFVR
jgi:hypothetical protein